MRFLDLTGQKYNRLTVTRMIRSTLGRPVKCECLCECGNETITTSNNIRNGSTKSCGCLKSDGNNTRHGLSTSPEYSTWLLMKGRCLNKKNKQFNEYGGRGIDVCKAWAEDFMAFYLDMGQRPTNKHQIDRINNNGGYEPDNCRWVTNAENQRNTRVSRIWVVNGDEYRSSTLAAISLGLSQSEVRRRCKSNKDKYNSWSSRGKYEG